MKLFCLTYAGGNSKFFNQIYNELLPDVDVVALEYSGHATRHREPFYNDFNELAEDMYSLIKDNLLLNEEYAVLGYSMGCIAAVEVLKLIIENNEIAVPCHVFLAAHEPSTNRFLFGYSDQEAEEIIKERTIKFGGVPEIMIDNKSFWRVYLPVLKADYSLISEYNFDELVVFNDIPATVFYSKDDTPLVSIKGWQKFFVKDCCFVEYSGTHFFINEHYAEMADKIRERLA